MTKEDIEQDIHDFVMGAELALFSGFDGIEIHTAHGYLLHQFFSPRTNKRTDEYGGSLENRTRFLVELLQALRKEFGTQVPILVRLSGSEHQPDGLTEDDFRDGGQLKIIPPSKFKRGDEGFTYDLDNLMLGVKLEPDIPEDQVARTNAAQMFVQMGGSTGQLHGARQVNERTIVAAAELIRAVAIGGG